MVADSLRYWAEEMHVDGFRFDLGTILAREPDGFDNQGGFLKVCGQDPILQTVKLVAEPWDSARRLPGRRLSTRLGGMER
jgi:glycogen operon protein